MIVSILRSIGAVIASLVVAMVLIVAVEGIAEAFHPSPSGLDPGDIEACKAFFANYPNWLFGVAVVLWGMTAFLCFWLATRLGACRHPAHGFGVGLLLFLAVIMNMWMLPYPFWFELSNLVLIPLGVFAGAMLGRGPTRSRQDAAAPA